MWDGLRIFVPTKTVVNLGLKMFLILFLVTFLIYISNCLSVQTFCLNYIKEKKYFSADDFYYLWINFIHLFLGV